MTVDEWLRMAEQSAAERGLVELPPLLASLARATRQLREADAARRPDPRVADQA